MYRNQKTFRPKKSAPSGSKVGLPYTLTYFFPILFGQGFVFLNSSQKKKKKRVRLSLADDICIVKMQGAQLQKHIDATLGSGNLREAVRLPPGEDINEWLAVNSNNFESVAFSNFRFDHDVVGVT